MFSLSVIVAAVAVPEGGLDTILQALAGLALAGTIGGLGLLVRYLMRKSGNELVKLALTRLQWAVGTAVRDVYQTYVEAIKEANADGKLTPAEQRRALLQALDRVKSLLGWKGIRLLARAFGVDNVGLDDFVAHHIEAEIADTKRVGRSLKTLHPRKRGDCAHRSYVKPPPTPIPSAGRPWRGP